MRRLCNADTVEHARRAPDGIQDVADRRVLIALLREEMCGRVHNILDAVGGAPGMFYYYFKSKQDIYVAVMVEKFSTREEKKLPA